MAARLNPRHTDMVIAKIKTTQLIKRLQNHAFGKLELTKTQVDAAKFLIERTVARANGPQDVNVAGSMTLQWPLPKTSLDQ